MEKLHRINSTMVAFHCPGCKCAHQVQVSGPAQPIWGWNGSMSAPTFTPSIRVGGVEPITDEEIERVMRGERIVPRPRCCHSFVTDGKIRFLNDCTHEFAGQTIEIPNWDD